MATLCLRNLKKVATRGVRVPLFHRHLASVRSLRCEQYGPSSLDLTELDVGLFSADPSKLLVPPGQRGRVFGGQVLGQALHAATTTVPEGRVVHSAHAYFLKAGRRDRPIIYHVESPSTGRSFATRRVLARQAGETIFQCQASFQLEDPDGSGLEHSSAMPEVPLPDELPSVEEFLADRKQKLCGSSANAEDAKRVLEAIQEFWKATPVELKVADGALDYLSEDPPALPARRRLWMRTKLPLPANSNLNHCAAAFFSDWSLLATALLPHRIAVPGLSGFLKLKILASLDHSMWFHAPFRADEWVLYDIESPRARSGRCLSFGKMYTLEGTLCATTAQEGLARLHRSEEEGQVALADALRT